MGGGFPKNTNKGLQKTIKLYLYRWGILLFVTFSLAMLSQLTLTNCGGAAEEDNPQDQNDQQLDTEDNQDLPPDADSDGIADTDDNCPDNANVNQFDSDSDGVGDVCDNCVDDQNADQADKDDDGLGDACDLIDNSMDDEKDEEEDLTEYPCSHPEATDNEFNCSQLAIFAGATSPDDPAYANINCSDFHMRGDCSARKASTCCLKNTCQIVYGNAFTCDVWENLLVNYIKNIPPNQGIESLTCESLSQIIAEGESLLMDGTCEDTADPDGLLKNEECCVIPCNSGVRCAMPGSTGNQDTFCEENVHQTSRCEEEIHCCREACGGDPTCTQDEDCGEFEKCSGGGCCMQKCIQIEDICTLDEECNQAGGEFCVEGCCSIKRL